MANLFLAEHSADVKDFLEMKIAGDWIALGPSAMWALEKNNISYSIPEDFHSAGDLEKVCIAAHEKLESLCNYLDEKLCEQYPELDSWGMRPFLFNIFPLTILFDTLVSRIFQIAAILRTYPSHTIWIHRAFHYPSDFFEITFSNRETLWGHILSLQGWHREIRFLRKRGTYDVLAGLKELALKFVATPFHKTNFIRRNLKRPEGLEGKENSNFLLMHGGLYEWKHILQRLKENKWQILFTEDKNFECRQVYRGRKNACRLNDIINCEDRLIDTFIFQGILFYPLIKERLSGVFDNSYRKCQAIVSKMRKLVTTQGIKAVLVSVSPTFTSHAVQQAARYLGLPVIVWQHGFMVEKNNRITQLNEFNDMMTSDIALTFGDEVTKAHLLYSDRFPSKIISVGSASIEKIRKANLGAREAFARKILYVTTIYYCNLWYCGFSPPLSDRYLFKDQLAISRGLGEMAKKHKAEVTIKLATGERDSDPPFIDQFSGVFKIVKDTPSFTELLDKNHIIIIDVPTTTALQAVATKKPVFILTNHIGLSSASKRMLEKRAFCTDNAETLIGGVERYIEHKLYPADVNNDEYLLAYATHRDDGGSIARVLDIVSGVVCGNGEINAEYRENIRQHIAE